MPTENTAQGLFNVVTTTKIKNQLLEEIARFEAETSKPAASDPANIQQYYPIMCNILQNMEINLDQNLIQNHENFLNDLKTQVGKLQELIIYTSPTLNSVTQFEKEVTDWARKNIDPTLIVNFQVKDDISGGFEYSYKGLYRNVTLDKFLENRIYDKIRL